jgi:hypothetical protein
MVNGIIAIGHEQASLDTKKKKIEEDAAVIACKEEAIALLAEVHVILSFSKEMYVFAYLVAHNKFEKSLTNWETRLAQCAQQCETLRNKIVAAEEKSMQAMLHALNKDDEGNEASPGMVKKLQSHLFAATEIAKDALTTAAQSELQRSVEQTYGEKEYNFVDDLYTAITWGRELGPILILLELRRSFPLSEQNKIIGALWRKVEKLMQAGEECCIEKRRVALFFEKVFGISICSKKDYLKYWIDNVFLILMSQAGIEHKKQLFFLLLQEIAQDPHQQAIMDHFNQNSIVSAALQKVWLLSREVFGKPEAALRFMLFVQKTFPDDRGIMPLLSESELMHQGRKLFPERLRSLQQIAKLKIANQQPSADGIPSPAQQWQQEVESIFSNNPSDYVEKVTLFCCMTLWAQCRALALPKLFKEKIEGEVTFWLKCFQERQEQVFLEKLCCKLVDFVAEFERVYPRISDLFVRDFDIHVPHTEAMQRKKDLSVLSVNSQKQTSEKQKATRHFIQEEWKISLSEEKQSAAENEVWVFAQESVFVPDSCFSQTKDDFFETEVDRENRTSTNTQSCAALVRQLNQASNKKLKFGLIAPRLNRGRSLKVMQRIYDVENVTLLDQKLQAEEAMVLSWQYDEEDGADSLERPFAYAWQQWSENFADPEYLLTQYDKILLPEDLIKIAVYIQDRRKEDSQKLIDSESFRFCLNVIVMLLLRQKQQIKMQCLQSLHCNRIPKDIFLWVSPKEDILHLQQIMNDMLLKIMPWMHEVLAQEKIQIHYRVCDAQNPKNFKEEMLAEVSNQLGIDVADVLDADVTEEKPQQAMFAEEKAARGYIETTLCPNLKIHYAADELPAAPSLSVATSHWAEDAKRELEEGEARLIFKYHDKKNDTHDPDEKSESDVYPIYIVKEEGHVFWVIKTKNDNWKRMQYEQSESLSWLLMSEVGIEANLFLSPEILASTAVQGAEQFSGDQALYLMACALVVNPDLQSDDLDFYLQKKYFYYEISRHYFNQLTAAQQRANKERLLALLISKLDVAHAGEIRLAAMSTIRRMLFLNNEIERTLNIFREHFNDLHPDLYFHAVKECFHIYSVEKEKTKNDKHESLAVLCVEAIRKGSMQAVAWLLEINKKSNEDEKILLSAVIEKLSDTERQALSASMVVDYNEQDGDRILHLARTCFVAMQEEKADAFFSMPLNKWDACDVFYRLIGPWPGNYTTDVWSSSDQEHYLSPAHGFQTAVAKHCLDRQLRLHHFPIRYDRSSETLFYIKKGRNETWAISLTANADNLTTRLELSSLSSHDDKKKVSIPIDTKLPLNELLDQLLRKAVQENLIDGFAMPTVAVDEKSEPIFPPESAAEKDYYLSWSVLPSGEADAKRVAQVEEKLAQTSIGKRITALDKVKIKLQEYKTGYQENSWWYRLQQWVGKCFGKTYKNERIEYVAHMIGKLDESRNFGPHGFPHCGFYAKHFKSRCTLFSSCAAPKENEVGHGYQQSLNAHTAEVESVLRSLHR